MKLKTLTRQDVENLADTALVFQRGQDYLKAGAVAKFHLEPDGESIQARVAGSEGLYRVAISEVDDDLEIECTCPYDGWVCKHGVAVLLFYINERAANNLSDALEQSGQAASGSVLAQTLEEMDHA